MITKLIVRNFKGIESLEIDLGQRVVFIGQNNSGKTSALQAISLWDLGLWAWLGSPGGKERSRNSAVAIGRKDIFAAACPRTALLWRDLRTRNKAVHIPFVISAEGISDGKTWTCGLEFDYTNPEFIYCRPMKAGDVHMLPPVDVFPSRVAYLQPMSGLASSEPKLEVGYINVLIGQGQTAQVLRNLCYQLLASNPSGWNKLVGEMKSSFGIEVYRPEFDATRGELTMSYRDRRGVELDISAGGRGMHLPLLLLAYLHSNPGRILLLDEPDAHLESLRQREIYQMLSDAADAQGCQIIMASHSEVVLEEAAGKGDSIVAFVGRPHLIKRTKEVLKALTDIGFEDYYQAMSSGWVLYLEGPSDLTLLKAFAKLIGHKAVSVLEAPFVHYLRNNVPDGARKHFHGLKEAKVELLGIALFDRIVNLGSDSTSGLVEIMWTKREFENYLCSKCVLLRWAKGNYDQGDMMESADAESKAVKMLSCIEVIEDSLNNMGRETPWGGDIKASDDFLIPLFRKFAKEMNLPPQTMEKSRFAELVKFMRPEEVDPEVVSVLDRIVELSEKITVR